MTPLRTRIAAAAIGAGLVVVTPAAAGAGPRRPAAPTATDSPVRPPDATARNVDIESVRARCRAAIDVRLPALSAAGTAVTAHPHVTDAHEVPLTTDIDATAARLRSLSEAIEADGDLATLREHCRSIFEDNRVFALVLPRTRLVLGADSATAAAARLDDLAATLESAIAEAETDGRDMTGARADLAAMRAEIASGRASAATVPGAVLGLTPADWNADHTILDPARLSLRSARSDLNAARDLARQIRHELRTPQPPV